MLIACVQESKLGVKSRLPAFPNYSVVRCDCVGGAGGLLTLVHHSLNYAQLDSPINDGVIECILIETSISSSKIQIANIYIPPASSAHIPQGHRVDLKPLLVEDTIILGDINGHNDEWSCGAADPRGDIIAGHVDERNFSVLNNPDIATRPSSDSSPDVAFVPSLWALNFDWQVSTTLNSDHLPLLLCLADESPPTCGGRLFVNFRKADWDKFKSVSEALFANLPPSRHFLS